MSAPSLLVQIGKKKAGVDDSPEAVAARKERWQQVRPRSAQVYLENKCHLKCQHCYESDESHPHDESLSLADYERIFEELARIGVLYLTFTGGEIFLRRDILDIIELARKKRFSVSLFTSGTLIDEHKANRLQELKVTEVHISVYSHDAAVHDGFTQVPKSWERSVRALRLLHERGIPTVMKANLMTFNVEHIDELIALAKSVGADYQLDPSVKPRMNGDRSPLRFAVPPDRLRRLVYHRPDLYEAFKMNAPGEYCTGEKSLLDDESVMCGAARGLVSIGADGGLYACGFFPVAAGSLKEQSLEDIWFGSAQLDAVRQTTFDQMVSCQGCDVKNTCSPCMAYGMVEHGDHRMCASSSRQTATAVRLLAEERTKKNAQMESGKKLPIVGELEVPRPPVKGGVSALSSE